MSLQDRPVRMVWPGRSGHGKRSSRFRAGRLYRKKRKCGRKFMRYQWKFQYGPEKPGKKMLPAFS